MKIIKVSVINAHVTAAAIVSTTVRIVGLWFQSVQPSTTRFSLLAFNNNNNIYNDNDINNKENNNNNNNTPLMRCYSAGTS